ncbi:radical SAM family heme chaperone HemW [Thermodesulfobacteriota bacterium]
MINSHNPPPIISKDQPAGLYVHIPFCLAKCLYCDFYSTADLSFKTEFIDALVGEMEMRGSDGLEFDSLYIGGGTPSVLEGEEIRRIIEAARRRFCILADAEITLEANPGTLGPDTLSACRDAGANRINIGVQSFRDKNLEFLGRIHTGRDAALALETARNSGFTNIGADLVYGLPEQIREDWLRDLAQVVEFGPEHLSCYMLTYEPGTPLNISRLDSRFRPLPDDQVGDLFETARTFLSRSGYHQYEISNFARSSSEGPEAFRSRHNQKYWSHAPYTGLGPSAHSFDGKQRQWNVSSVKQYIAHLSSGRLPVAEKESLSREQLMMEAVFLGLRQTRGISVDEFDRNHGVRFKTKFGEALNTLEGKGYIELTENRCALTSRGMLFLDSIVAMLL